MKEIDYKNIIQAEKDFLVKMETKLPIYSMFRDFERHQLIVSFLHKIIRVKEKVNENIAELIPLNAYLRYIFETLIQTELLIKEPEYKFKLFYSVYNHQVSKSIKFLERLNREIDLMRVYEKNDNSLLESIIVKGIEEGKDPEEVKQLHKEKVEELDDKSDLEFTIFTGDYKNNGYSFSAFLMEAQLVPKYEARIKEMENLRTDKAKELVKDSRLTKHFNFKRQHTRVFKLLSDDRSWKTMAETVSLETEYDLVYDITSSILHSTSYSLITNSEPEEDEIGLAKELIYKYSKKILQNCILLSDSNVYEKFIVVDVSEEEE